MSRSRFRFSSTNEVEPAEQAAYAWASFLAAMTDEERRRLAMANPDIDKATRALEQLSQDPKARMLPQWREDELKLWRVSLATAEQRGWTAGEASGLDRGRTQGLQQAIESLCDVLDIPLDETRRGGPASSSPTEPRSSPCSPIYAPSAAGHGNSETVEPARRRAGNPPSTAPGAGSPGRAQGAAGA